VEQYNTHRQSSIQALLRIQGQISTKNILNFQQVLIGSARIMDILKRFDILTANF
jgi:hypothetical protein